LIANIERRKSMERNLTERKSMDLVNFIVWLTAGAVIAGLPTGWLRPNTCCGQTNQPLPRMAALRRAKPAGRKVF